MEFDEAKELAMTLVNVKTRKRLEPAHTTGERLLRLYKLYGAWDAVEKKLDISSEMRREFTETTKLPQKVKKIFEDNYMFHVDIEYRITKLKEDEDKTRLAKAIVDQNLTSLDVRDIVTYKIANSEASIEKAIQRVLESKTKVVTHHVVVMELDKKTLADLENEKEKLKRPLEDLALASLSKGLNKEWILSFGMRGGDIIVKLSEEGFKELQKKARSSGVQLKDLANLLIKNGLRSIEM